MGLERAAFLHVEDLIRPDDFEAYLSRGGSHSGHGEGGRRADGRSESETADESEDFKVTGADEESDPRRDVPRNAPRGTADSVGTRVAATGGSGRQHGAASSGGRTARVRTSAAEREKRGPGSAELAGTPGSVSTRRVTLDSAVIATNASVVALGQAPEAARAEDGTREDEATQEEERLVEHRQAEAAGVAEPNIRDTVDEDEDIVVEDEDDEDVVVEDEDEDDSVDEDEDDEDDSADEDEDDEDDSADEDEDDEDDSADEDEDDEDDSTDEDEDDEDDSADEDEDDEDDSADEDDEDDDEDEDEDEDEDNVVLVTGRAATPAEGRASLAGDTPSAAATGDEQTQEVTVPSSSDAALVRDLGNADARPELAGTTARRAVRPRRADSEEAIPLSGRAQPEPTPSEPGIADREAGVASPAGEAHTGRSRSRRRRGQQSRDGRDREALTDKGREAVAPEKVARPSENRDDGSRSSKRRRRRRGRGREGQPVAEVKVKQQTPDRHKGRHGRVARNGIPSRVSRSVPITEVVKEGDQVIVQVSKEPIGTKGARVTSHISLPGRYAVYLPTVDHVGISKRIGSGRERARLREVIEALKPPTGGLIVRTVAEGLTKKALKRDIAYLIKLWEDVSRKRSGAKVPSLLYTELDLVLKTARDLFTPEIERIVIDDKEQYHRLVRFVEMFMPERVKDVELYTGGEPIFDAFGIEDEIGRALSRKVPLPSGGYLVIDQAEALTAIDVNTGRYVGKGSKDLEETALKTNLEAVAEIAYQLRFRNIGGLIILDLIDMDHPANRDAVWRALEQALARDKAKTTLNRISELGLIEMTRKRTRESLSRTMHEPCFYCDGTGQIQSRATIGYEILRQIRRELSTLKGYRVLVNAHPAICDLMTGEEKAAVVEAEKRYMRRIEFSPRREYHIEQFDLQGR